jgi:hypothetical protein
VPLLWDWEPTDPDEELPELPWASGAQLLRAWFLALKAKGPGGNRPRAPRPSRIKR